MKYSLVSILKGTAALLLAFLSGIAASSFYIGDRNLLVTIVSLGLIAFTLWLVWRLWRNNRRTQSSILFLVAVLGCVFSIFGIC
ncbi:MAG: hypothetical protein ACOYJF_08725 [Prevotella sp.]|jgi:ABC-type nickel/cobalt efflux system permease component RcnA